MQSTNHMLEYFVYNCLLYLSVADVLCRGQRFAPEQLGPGRVSPSTQDGFNSIRWNSNHPWNEVIIAPSSNDQVCLVFLLTSRLYCPRPLNSKYCSNNMPWVQWVHDTVCQQGNDPYPPWPGRLRNQEKENKSLHFATRKHPLHEWAAQLLWWMPAGKAPLPSASLLVLQPTALELYTYGLCSLWQRPWKMIQTVCREARVALNRLKKVCVHFYIYTALGLGQGRGNLRCPIQLSSACQKLPFIFQDSLHMTQLLEFSFNPRKCLKWIKDERR